MSRAGKLLIAAAIATLLAIAALWSRSTTVSVAPMVVAARNEGKRGEHAVVVPASMVESETGATVGESRVEVDSEELAPASISIHGRVVDEDGSAIELFAVEATRLGERNDVVEQLELPLSRHAGGEFDLVGLAPGRWAVEPRVAGMKVADEPQFETQTARRVDFAMFRVGVVRVRVLDKQRGAIANAVLWIDGEPRAVCTDARGVVELTLEPGNHLVSALAAGFVDDGEQFTYVSTLFRANDVELTMHRAATVRGTLNQVSGQPVANWRVSSNFSGEPFTTTDAAGQFELSGIRVGRVRVFFSAPRESGGQSPALALELVLHEAEVKQVAVLLPRERPVRVGGRVISAQLESGSVTFTACDGQLTTGDSPSAQVDASGAFEVMLPSIGCYRVSVSGTSRDNLRVQFEAGTIEVPDQDEFELTRQL